MTSGYGFKTVFGVMGEEREDKTFVVLSKRELLDKIRKIQSDLAMTQILEGSENIGDNLYRCELMESINKSLLELKELMK